MKWKAGEIARLNIGFVEVQLNPSRMLVPDQDVSILCCGGLGRTDSGKV